MHEKIADVLNIVRVGTVDQFDGLIKSLKETNQEAVVSILRHKTGMITLNMSCFLSVYITIIST